MSYMEHYPMNDTANIAKEAAKPQISLTLLPAVASTSGFATTAIIRKAI